jgi:hypothetical protein
VRPTLSGFALALLLLALAPPGAHAAPAKLHARILACVTGNANVARRQGCRTVPGTGSARGEEPSGETGLDGLHALAVAGRGSLYAVGSRNSALVDLRASSSRRLAFAACFSGDSFLDGCAHIPGASANADQAPIANPTAAAASPDGRSVYVGSGNFTGSTIARFARNPLTGRLAYQGCVSGSVASGPAGGGCALVPGATAEGEGSGLEGVSGIAVSRDGRRLYATAAEDESVVLFARDPSSGALSFRGCIATNPGAAPCRQLPRGRHLLGGVRSPLLSADGRSLYVAAPRGDSVTAFAVGKGGVLAFAGCATASRDMPNCDRPRGNSPLSALSNAGGLAESGDGRFVYATSSYGSVVAFARRGPTGRLAARSCLSGVAGLRGACRLVPGARPLGGSSPLSGAAGALVRGRTLLIPARSLNGIVELRRGTDGGLSFAGCISATLRLSRPAAPCGRIPHSNRVGWNTGFYKDAVLAPGPKGAVYAGSGGDATVALLRLSR